MEKKDLEDLSYKELVRRLIVQVDQTNECFKALDAREIIMQKQMERIQVTLNHKTDKENFVQFVQQVTDFISAFKDDKIAKAKKHNDTLLARALNKKFEIGLIITLATWILTQLIPRLHW